MSIISHKVFVCTVSQKFRDHYLYGGHIGSCDLHIHDFTNLLGDLAIPQASYRIPHFLLWQPIANYSRECHFYSTAFPSTVVEWWEFSLVLFHNHDDIILYQSEVCLPADASEICYFSHHLTLCLEHHPWTQHPAGLQTFLCSDPVHCNSLFRLNQNIGSG